MFLSAEVTDFDQFNPTINILSSEIASYKSNKKKGFR